MAPNEFSAFPAIVSVSADLDPKLYPGFFVKIDYINNAYEAVLGHKNCHETQFMLRDETQDIYAVLHTVSSVIEDTAAKLANKMVLTDSLPKELEYLVAE